MNLEQKVGWHWPSFSVSISNEMSEREHLGFKSSFTEQRFARSLATAYGELRTKSLEELLAIAESPNTSIECRICAGNILGLLGDPRINTYRPNMISIPAADVEIGLSEGEVDTVFLKYKDLGLERKWIVKEAPRHPIRLTSYKIAKFPVTNLEFRDFLLDTGYQGIPTSWEFGIFPTEKANHPTYTVTADAADEYARWLSKKTGRRFRLPTEAEWEYAAAGPDGLEFPWGNEFICDLANTAELGVCASLPIGIFTAGNSYFGVSDMAGNVEEYVADNYRPYAQGKFVTDHLVELNGEYRVARGGSFTRFRDLARTKRRHGRNAVSRVYVMGFRLAEDE